MLYRPVLFFITVCFGVNKLLLKPPQLPLPLRFRHPAGGGPSHGHRQHPQTRWKDFLGHSVYRKVHVMSCDTQVRATWWSAVTLCVLIVIGNCLPMASSLPRRISSRRWYFGRRPVNPSPGVRVRVAPRSATIRFYGDTVTFRCTARGGSTIIDMPFIKFSVRPRPHQQQCQINRQHCRSNVRLCRSNIRLCCHKRHNVERFYCKISANLNVFNLFRLCRKDEISFDIVAETGNIVAKNGNNVEATFDIVERVVQLVAFDIGALTLLLMWTGLLQSCLLLRQCCFNIVAGMDGT